MAEKTTEPKFDPATAPAVKPVDLPVPTLPPIVLPDFRTPPTAVRAEELQTAPLAEPPKPKHRDQEAIKADLARARAQHLELMPLVEADRLKRERSIERVEREQKKWKLSHDADEPFDPSAFSPPLVAHAGDKALHTEFHKSHYRVARLELELARAVEAAATTA